MILETIRTPADLRKLAESQLPEVALEIRRKILEVVLKNGGHLGSGMGVVELTIALHYLYDFERDRLFFDTGHQCYPHKLLTGRLDRFDSLRQHHGISGFPNIDESPFDMMTSGHAGTALSMGLGTCLGDWLGGEGDRKTVVVVGDASIVSGISFEALNAAGHREQDLLVILNDNEQSIGKSVGSLAKMLSRIRMSKMHSWAKDKMLKIERLLSSIPVIGEKMDKSLHEFAEQVKHALIPATMFEELGFTYYGIYDGHSIPEMLEVMRNVRQKEGIKLLHVLTVKGKGVSGCEEDPLALHGAKPGDELVLEADSKCAVEKVDPPAGPLPDAPKKAVKYDFAKCFSQAFMVEADKNHDLIGITAGMPDGTGLVPFSKKYPERFFNVGIAEQHAVAFASGLSISGRRPVFVVYSTFLQRGFDQVFQEVALQRAPVTLMLSHGGIAGEDGATHHGLFDIAMLRCLPGIELLGSRDGPELQAMFRWAIQQGGPVAIRYPKANTLAPGREVLPIERGKAEILREGEDVALLGYGPMSEVALEAAELLDRQGFSCLVANGRFARPLDSELLERLCTRFRWVITVEEGSLAGGFGSAVLEFSSRQKHLTARVFPLGVPDRFIEHGARDTLLSELGLNAAGIASTVLELTREEARLRSAPY